MVALADPPVPSSDALIVALLDALLDALSSVGAGSTGGFLMRRRVLAAGIRCADSECCVALDFALDFVLDFVLDFAQGGLLCITSGGVAGGVAGGVSGGVLCIVSVGIVSVGIVSAGAPCTGSTLGGALFVAAHLLLNTPRRGRARFGFGWLSAGQILGVRRCRAFAFGRAELACCSDSDMDRTGRRDEVVELISSQRDASKPKPKPTQRVLAGAVHNQTRCLSNSNS